MISSVGIAVIEGVFRTSGGSTAYAIVPSQLATCGPPTRTPTVGSGGASGSSLVVQLRPPSWLTATAGRWETGSKPATQTAPSALWRRRDSRSGWLASGRTVRAVGSTTSTRVTENRWETAPPGGTSAAGVSSRRRSCQVRPASVLIRPTTGCPLAAVGPLQAFPVTNVSRLSTSVAPTKTVDSHARCSQVAPPSVEAYSRSQVGTGSGTQALRIMNRWSLSARPAHCTRAGSPDPITSEPRVPGTMNTPARMTATPVPASAAANPARRRRHRARPFA